MSDYFAAFHEAVQTIADAANRTTADFAAGQIPDENAFTDRMLTRIVDAIDDKAFAGVRWHGLRLPDRGTGAAEHFVGADFVGIFESRLPNYHVIKGLLVQAKVARGRGYPGYKDLAEQCDRMLGITPASFVLFYTDQGVRVVPAISIKARQSEHNTKRLRAIWRSFFSMSIGRFYEEHLRCAIGDRRLTGTSIEGVVQQIRDILGRQNYKPSNLLYIGAKPDDL